MKVKAPVFAFGYAVARKGTDAEGHVQGKSIKKMNIVHPTSNIE
jgi:hypothetical protein